MLNPEQWTLLDARFQHFSEEKSAPLFHADQSSQHTVEGKKYPAIKMATGTWWFPDREHRPVVAGKDGTTRILKTKAPKGMRTLLVDALDAQEILVVEGEGGAVAAMSVGLKGVVCAGGVGTLLTKSPQAAEHRRQIFQGKSTRLAFDPDAAGRASVTRAARNILEAGAVRVAIIDLPQEGQDLEDWLGTFDTAELALGALLKLLGATAWEGAEDLQKREKEQSPTLQFVQSKLVHQAGDTVPTLVVMVYDEETRKAQLAVYGPMEDLPSEVLEYGQEAMVDRGWRLLDSWRYGGEEYLPDMGGDIQTNLDERTLVLPPPPALEPMSSVDLWVAIRAFIRKWVAVPAPLYDPMTGYVFMTYRLKDGQFQYVPYLRFYGPTGKGKGRGLDVMSALCWRSYTSQPSSGNLHRLIEFLGDITLIFDEFHLDRGMSRESQQRLIDILNLGNKRGQGLTRVEEVHGRRVIKHFPLFGAKCFGGYGHDEEESLARRTVNIPMGTVPVPAEMNLLALPPEFYAEAAMLRSHLLAFRARKLALGMPDPRNPRALELRDRAGPEVAQVFFPLVSMVPEALKEELRSVMDCAVGRKAAAQQTREASPEAYLLEALAKVVDDGLSHPLQDGQDGDLFVTTADLYEAQDRWDSPAVLARKLQSLGVPHGRKRISKQAGGTAPRGGFLLRLKDRRLGELMARHGIIWPRPGKDVIPAF